MFIRINDWQFDVDMAATMAYSATEAAEHCLCGYCRNFYAAIDQVYPNLRPFLAQFGIDITAPDELLPYEPTVYRACYCVSGRILQQGSGEITIDGISVIPEVSDQLYRNTGCPAPILCLSVGLIVLPWVLEEPMEDVESPANLPSFLKRMWDALLNRKPNDQITS